MIGQSIAHYKVTAKLGAGGMGEVYRATDTKLGRDVALKVLPEAFAQDAQRMARFQREAQVLASLNHPHIAAIYGLEGSAGVSPVISAAASSAAQGKGTGGDGFDRLTAGTGVTALVMELVEGPTLAERIGAQGAAAQAGRMLAVPIDEALPIARQIAEALEYAHERGIVHRDLKPANIKLTSDGQVKVLDFGLAKALAEDSVAPDVANSPTLSVAATKAGFILGTAAYMSPEQARGKSADRRADVWSFGVVLYEMLTGARAFAGEDVSVTLANVIKEDPDWKKLPANIPRRIRELLERCLMKEPRQRLQAIGEARIALEQAIAHPEAEGATGQPAMSAAAGKLWTMLPWAVAALFVLTTIAAWQFNKSTPAEALVRRFAVSIPPGQSLFGPNPAVTISPDGKRLAYLASRVDSAGWQLFIRSLDQVEPEPLGNSSGTAAFFSPDGEWIGFNQDSKLMKAPLNGGPAVTIADGAPWTGASWGRDGYIYFSPDFAGGLHRVAASGGHPEKIEQPGRPPMIQRWPEVLPEGNAVLFAEASIAGGTFDRASISVLSLKDGTVKTLIPNGTHPKYVASGHLVYAQAGTIFAVAFDAQRLEVLGQAVPVVRGVRMEVFTGAAYFSVSRGGDLVYLTGAGVQADATEMVWVDRKGVAQSTGAPVRALHSPRLSPDGKRIAARLGEENVDIAIYDLARGILSRLTFQPEEDESPVWTPDGRRVAYSASGIGTGTGGPPRNIVWKNADGSGVEEILWSGGTHTHVSSISPDQRWLLFTDYASGSSGDIWVLPLQGERKPRPFLQTQFNEFDARFSPDGKWVVYTCDESGKNEVYVQGFPDPSGGKWQISAGGGDSGLWSGNGREILFRQGDKVMTASSLSATFAPTAPRLLFEGNYASLPRREADYDVASDGRLLMLKAAANQSASAQYNVVLNWAEELKRLAPRGKR